MTTRPKELSPERCHLLREGGFLRLLVNLLHEHTFESQDKPEADFNIELFFMDFNRKAELRNRSAQQLRTIVGHTAKNEDELNILEMLEVLRKYIKRLYHFIVGWKAMTEDAGRLNESTNQLTDLAGQVKEVIKVLKTLTGLKTIIEANKTCSIFEQFGGVFVIVDYLRAQTRFNAKCHQFESDLADSSQLVGVINDSKFVLRKAVAILYYLVYDSDSKDDIRLFLGDSRSLHEIMVGIAEDAYDHGDFDSVEDYCCLIYRLYSTYNLGHAPVGVVPSTSHLKDCGVIKLLTKFGMETKDPVALWRVIMTLEAPLALDRRNVLEFVSIDGSVDMLIDVLVPSKEKDEDVENAEWYAEQRYYSASVLNFINQHLWTQNRIDGPLLAIYESRDLVAILVHHLEQSTPIPISKGTTLRLFELLKDILVSSEYQRWKFSEIGNGKEVVKRFESSEYPFYVEISKEIGEMLE